MARRREYQYDEPSISFDGVPRSFHFGDPGEGIDQGALSTGPNSGVQYRNQFNRTFSGADYHITAVIPYEADYQARVNKEAREIRKQIDIIESTFQPGQSIDPDLLQRVRDLKRAEETARNRQEDDTDSVFYKTFAELQTLSITSRRSIHPVRRLGEKDATYHTRGPRTWAGSMVFVQLDGDVLLDLYRRTHYDLQSNEPFFAVDRIPPFNIHIQGINEYGHIVEGIVHGVTIVATGQVLSIDDLYTEQQVTYTAVHHTPLTRASIRRSLKTRLADQRAARGFGAISEQERVAIEAAKRGGVPLNTPVVPRKRSGELRRNQ